MNTKVTIAAAVLVLAIVFGFIFWNQFSSNQQQLAGGNPNQSNTVNTTSKSSVPKNDNVSSIETDLNAVDASTIDNDSTQFNAELNGF